MISMKTIDGWIFDVYLAGRDIVVWVIDASGHAHLLRDTFIPAFYIGGDVKDLRASARFLMDQPWDLRLSWTERIDPELAYPIVVLQVEVMNPNHFATIFELMRSARPNLPYYNDTLPILQMYLLMRNAFATAYCQFTVDQTNRIRAFEVDSSSWADDHPLPPLRHMVMHIQGNPLSLGADDSSPFIVKTDGRREEFDLRAPRKLLDGLRELLIEYDPDIIETEWGDAFLLPRLSQLAKRYNVCLPLHRDPTRTPGFSLPLSYYSYTCVAFMPFAQILFGRWHIDRANPFIESDPSLDHPSDLARQTRLPVQRLVRSSARTITEAVNAAEAFRSGTLIPCRGKPLRQASDSPALIPFRLLPAAPVINLRQVQSRMMP